MCVNFPELERWLIESEQKGVGYRVTVGKQKATEEDVSPLLLPFGEREVFSITPVIAGAGRGTGQVLFGIALIATAIVFAPAAGGFLGIGGSGAITGATGITLGAAASSAIGTVGLSLVLGGVAQMLSPTPQPQSYEEAKQLESFSFSGIVNTSRQGVPVPIVLGRAYAGSVVISSGLDVVQD